MINLQEEIKATLGNLETEKMESFIKHYSENKPEKESVTFTPMPGFVIKTKILKSEEYPENTKVFINICYSEMVPKPHMDQAEIEKAMEGDESSTFRIPMSLSMLRSDVDKQGAMCVVVDACINPFIVQDLAASANTRFKGFTIEMVLAWVEQKYKLLLKRELGFPRMLQKGNLALHCIMKEKRAIVTEIVDQSSTEECSRVDEKSKPSYNIVYEPTNNPVYMTIQIYMPLHLNSKGVELDLEDRRLILESSRYYLEVPLMFSVGKCNAEFDVQTKYLYVNCKIS